MSEHAGDTSERYLRPHYAPGVPGVIAPVTEPLSRMLDDATRRYPDRLALDFMGASTTYSQLSRQVAQAAETLRALGVRPGDVVGVILPNCPQHVVIAYAVWRLGAILAEHNPLAPAAQLREQVEIHRGTVIIAWEKTLARLVQASGSLSAAGLTGRRVLSVDLSRGLPWTSRLALNLPVAAARAQRSELRGKVPSDVRSWDDLMAACATLPAGHRLPDVDDTAVLLYTGGTTGTPKAVKLTHRNLRSNAEMSLAWASQACEHGQETFYSVLPFFHAFGLSLSLLCAVGMAATQVILPKFSADMVLAAWRRHPATFFPGVPVMFDRVVTRANATGADLSSCKIAVCGAAANPRAVAEAWEEATGGVIIEGYGMTESSPITLGNPISPERRPGALGVPYPSTDVRIVDPEDPDTEVAPGEVGELLVRGPQVFAGYWENPEETDAVLLPGGWLRTGDLVRQEADGFYVIADRRKELIISGGFNIYPTEVEAAVRSMPEVEDVAVVGLPGDAGNEHVVAAIVPKEGQTVSLEQVRAWAERTLSHYALPRQVAILSEMPRSQIGKILRRVVREELLAAREAASAASDAVASSIVERLGEGARDSGDGKVGGDGKDAAR
ncbi:MULTISPECIES: AMP-binding protein [unclassified Actinomyces]|uniref:AMP-binding protein n=2 Tax=Actinomyces TaxID=1654 RepID=UPI002016B0B6|nr:MULTISPECIES: AMP-binding protein [unclassified Actinomyces]MCL3778264.1 AMP-binding protein [Actinomyces sp. AC-20-1]MCL3790442.1 AMP-binding protein [Actinomyces sp. 187325]MCL3792719.1 AMP-binding protein [Actinomyces sp. 186855]MCL3795199.1 AMP-binding protein [Actinomyces sp. 217892]